MGVEHSAPGMRSVSTRIESSFINLVETTNIHEGNTQKGPEVRHCLAGDLFLNVSTSDQKSSLNKTCTILNRYTEVTKIRTSYFALYDLRDSVEFSVSIITKHLTKKNRWNIGHNFYCCPAIPGKECACTEFSNTQLLQQPYEHTNINEHSCEYRLIRNKQKKNLVKQHQLKNKEAVAIG